MAAVGPDPIRWLFAGSQIMGLVELKCKMDVIHVSVIMHNQTAIWMQMFKYL